ncbi:MAG: hypothetical protein PF693_21640 [Spirochaetia bacterium]|nr:hypothetical protein [Spirochaetia bacterium]
MGNWATENSNAGALKRYTPRDLTDSKDFARELQNIDNNQTLTIMDKYKSKKQLMRAVYTAKQDEINHHLDSFQNYLLARKDVESKTIALEAQKAIMLLEKDQLQLMKDIGLSHSDEISDTLIKAGTMQTEKLLQVKEAPIEAGIKLMTMQNIRTVWDKTNKRIMENVDTYMDELQQRENNLKRL